MTADARALPDAAGDATGALLDVSALSCAIGGRSLWQDLSFSVHAGERLAVSAPSGSGKTVLLRTLAGLRDATAGTIRFQDTPIAEWHMPAYRARVTWVPQRPILAEARVRDILSAPFALRIHRQRSFPLDTVHEFLDHLKLPASFLDQHGDDLSGGETQMVATLRAMLIEPTVLLLDEPTASLDASRAAAIESLLAQWLQHESPRAYLWTSHDPDQLQRVADRTLNPEQA
ncbi:MAG: ATP-binding cassette domain-containing protein [Rhodanobacteraceae bacterium]